MNKTEILQNCTIDGNIVRLPEGQLERKLYQEVAKALELIGGKWKGGKTAGFVFPIDPTGLLEQIVNGENRNLKKEFQFFATPDTLADLMVEMAGIKRDHWILEPSAGQGSIIHAINRELPGKQVHWFETMEINRTFLTKIETGICDGWDFLTDPCPYKYDRIIANPPFTKNQDIDHIRKMYEYLNEGGRIVTLSSSHWLNSSNKKETEFKNWLDEIGATYEERPTGEFKESGTNIATVLIIIDK